MRKASLGVLLVLLHGPGATAQQPVVEVPVTFGEVYSVELVMVPVIVRGQQAGQPIDRERFALRVDGAPVAVESFESDPAGAVSLVVLQDLSGSMAEPGKLDSSREALDCWLDASRSGDELALATFAGGRTQVEVPLTGDVSPLREAMGLWEAWGTTGLYDAVAMLPEISLAAGAGRRAAVLVTDGVDNASAIAPEEAALLVQQAELPVYVLALAGHAAPPVDPGVYRYADLLQQLAATTGGRYYAVTDPAEARRTCAAILQELRHQYVLGFSVSGTGPSRFRPIEVDVRGLGRRASLVHRRGYRGTAPSQHVARR